MLLQLLYVTEFWKTYHQHTSEIITLPPYNSDLQGNQKYFYNYYGNSLIVSLTDISDCVMKVSY